MIIERTDRIETHEDLTAEEVIEKTREALDDPTVTAIKTYPRWQRREWDREARRLRRKGTFRRSYR